MNGVPARLLTTHVEAHLDELESLLSLRAAAAAGRHWTLPRVLEVDERIAAHVAALQLFGAALPSVIAPFIPEHPLAIAFIHDGSRPVAPAACAMSELGEQAQLATAENAATIAAALWALPPSTEAHEALADLGRPADVPPLIVRFSEENVHHALSAGNAFTVLTGCRCDGQQRVVLPPIDGSAPDVFEREFLDQAWLPDAALAAAHWQRLRPTLEQASRINRGYIVDDATAEAHPGLDRRAVVAAAARFRRVAPP